MEKNTDFLTSYSQQLDVIYTGTKEYKECCESNFDWSEVEVDTADTCSLYDLVKSFNKLYAKFKKEYDQLSKFNIGKKCDFLRFHYYNDGEVAGRVLTFSIESPMICPGNWAKLFFVEKNGEIQAFVTNGLWEGAKRYFKKSVSFDSKLVKRYLDIFEKYQLLCTLYQFFKYNEIFRDGYNSLYTIINGTLLDGLESFDLVCGRLYFKSEYIVQMSFDLGEDFGINYDNCNVSINQSPIPIEREDIAKFAKNTHVHTKHIQEGNYYS